MPGASHPDGCEKRPADRRRLRDRFLRIRKAQGEGQTEIAHYYQEGAPQTESQSTFQAQAEGQIMLKVILADNQAIFRAGIAKVLAVEDDVRIVAQAQSLEQFVMALEKFRS